MDCGDGELMTVSMFGEAEQADASRELARRWTEQSLEDFEFSTLDAVRGEVLVSRAARDMLESGHPRGQHRFASIRRYKLRSRSVAELMHRVDESLADQIAAIDGVEAYHALDCDGGDLLSMTFGRGRALEQESDEMARQFVGEHLADEPAQQVECERLLAERSGETQQERYKVPLLFGRRLTLLGGMPEEGVSALCVRAQVPEECRWRSRTRSHDPSV